MDPSRKIASKDLQMKPYRSDELVHKLFYETSRFSAFNNQWVVKARVTGSQRDPTQSSHREITYQLILKTKTAAPMSVHHLVVHGPFGDARVQHRIHRFEFSDQESESPEVQLPLVDAAECNRLLASKAINFSAEPSSAYYAGESSSNPPEEQENNEEIYEPETKRKKAEKSSEPITEKLEHRLGGILCCAVCLDLPRAAVFQCTNGHLMCAGCFTHLLADARLRDEVATCPNCRVEIGRSSASRNLAVEKAVSELPAECQYCNREFPRNSLDRHQETLCEERLIMFLVSK
ncbi:hypothetical protein J437_LFUL013221 [Ladona fulva]|uniref:RING-type domain-containing protein n=1 Tax=Ladona fulva TaxID=123851 RepID=A0A8K0KED6_LADFU|nr:hypothetical protein J437_LFUL013221 [Ladona fulva]